ncbi:putative transcription factor bZIP family [Rosa chinensis]|uniref:Putative transcription factor bZIP family n=1 Tax=Rosa chinensis TaxID=74649 RepID=A0A2P6RBR3_ROSCH|nr:protein ABSCISIC ACID-INSENSITIVE 5 [Rosa chinensis]XP_040373207.1 protein ABSCISIC ACID-INSENSITIVE 5 [Rosa chinensis]XP_040373208.1 protein ABSCISIC ACID-INSENSITIVE 5 [Rosa chinensis]XP_040373209.1 protein ABSCISIC ACID-INSENSITIVE 5 [Rosa chinensis]XP_040373210.1 protein ABSCISIC ACID-INSENSITIVE 5 [Rosa chinensis]XP_040373211.1 protein ABSCISIC ACID-INSENSITIVE 5 [Rosa chinensis]PRQ43875.1 putative transcription factor bZIP family [Rosa chinensis]
MTNTTMGGVSESEMMSHGKEELPGQSDQYAKNNQLFTSLGRQSSIYSLTLDEFQHTLSENGKNFGSMNMDEFLNSIWTAEENQAINSTHHNNSNNLNPNHINNISNNNVQHPALSEITMEKEGVIAKQPSLPRQGSLTLPAPLCRKTVDEVWSEMHKEQKAQAQQQNSNHNNSNDGAQNSEYVPRQPTFGEMTLEDFLVKAGVVREPDSMSVVPLPPQPQQQPQQYGIVGQSFVMGMGANAGASTSTTPVLPNYQTIPQGGAPVGESSGYVTNGKRNGAYPPPPPQAVCFGGRVVNGGGGYAPTQPIGMATSVSPVSSDGMCASQIENSGGQYAMDMGALRGRKRIIDGPVEKVVERRQRRMIKNRESAARSRARKQAYTVELEAELNQLREENANLKQALAELEMKRKQQYCEEMRKRVQSRAQKAVEKLWMLKRSHSCAV